MTDIESKGIAMMIVLAIILIALIVWGVYHLIDWFRYYFIWRK